MQTVIIDNYGASAPIIILALHVLMGYFFGKILASCINKITLRAAQKPQQNDTRETNNLKSLAPFCFWLFWFLMICHGLYTIQNSLKNMFNWPMGVPKIMALTGLAFIGYLGFRITIQIFKTCHKLLSKT